MKICIVSDSHDRANSLLAAITGAQAVIHCGALAFSEPDKSQKQIRDIVESACDHGVEMIVTPCQLCQANVEIYQFEINQKQGTKFAMPVVYYSQLMTRRLRRRCQAS